MLRTAFNVVWDRVLQGGRDQPVFAAADRVLYHVLVCRFATPRIDGHRQFIYTQKMVARSILLRALRGQKILLHVPSSHSRSIKTKATHKTPSVPPASTPVENKSWLTHKVETSPAARRVFVGLTNLLGYGSPKQVAGRRALLFYERVCAVKPDEGSQFWQNGPFISFILFKKVPPSYGLSNN